MKKQNLITRSAIVLLALVGFNAKAQQDPMYSQYLFNTMAINPAYAGSTDMISIMALHRSQWSSFEGAPTTQTILGHMPLKDENMGLGLSIVNDAIGPTKQTGFYANYSYRLKIDNQTDLRLGLKLGGNLFSANLTDLDLSESSDVAFQTNISNQFLPNFGFGMYWKNEKYFVGLSLPKLMRNELGSELVATSTTEEFVFNQKRHFFLIGGYIMDLNPDVQFKPSFVFKHVAHAPSSFDLSANFFLKQKLWLGANYRFGDSFGAQVQYIFNDINLRVGYGYDYTLSALGAYTGATHEIMVRYDIARKRADEGTPSVAPIDQ